MRVGGIEVEAPAGFSPFPLSDIDNQLDRTLGILSPLSPSQSQGVLEDIVGTLRTSLEQMRRAGVRYCGMGWHRLPDSDEQVSSWLTVNVQEFGPARNPRLALDEFLRGLPRGAGAADPLIVEGVDGRPIAFYDNLADDVAYYQLRAAVPADDGARLAVVELSTAAVAHGPRFWGAVAEVARSIRFAEPRTGVLSW